MNDGHPKHYRMKQGAIEAMQYDGANGSAISAWSNGVVDGSRGDGLKILTLEGEAWMTVDLGDFVILSAEGEFYPIRESIFRETYEPVIA